MTWEPIAVVASLWFAAGMTCASTLYRRGHDGWHWMFVCGLAGPLAFLVVADQARTVERDTRPRTIARAGTPRDAIAVLVPAAIVTTRRAHHPRTLGRLTRLAAEHPGVSVLVLDPASLAAGTVRAA